MRELKETDLKLDDEVYFRDKNKPYTVTNLGSKGFETINEWGGVAGSDDVSEYSLMKNKIKESIDDCYKSLAKNLLDTL